jgi:hypothetical protein
VGLAKENVNPSHKADFTTIFFSRSFIIQQICHSSQQICHSSQQICHSSQQICHSSQQICHSSQQICHSSQQICHSYSYNNMIIKIKIPPKTTKTIKTNKTTTTRKKFPLS